MALYFKDVPDDGLRRRLYAHAREAVALTPGWVCVESGQPFTLMLDVGVLIWVERLQREEAVVLRPSSGLPPKPIDYPLEPATVYLDELHRVLPTMHSWITAIDKVWRDDGQFSPWLSMKPSDAAT